MKARTLTVWSSKPQPAGLGVVQGRRLVPACWPEEGEVKVTVMNGRTEARGYTSWLWNLFSPVTPGQGIFLYLP